MRHRVSTGFAEQAVETAVPGRVANASILQDTPATLQRAAAENRWCGRLAASARTAAVTTKFGPRRRRVKDTVGVLFEQPADLAGEKAEALDWRLNPSYERKHDLVWSLARAPGRLGGLKAAGRLGSRRLETTVAVTSGGGRTPSRRSGVYLTATRRKSHTAPLHGRTEGALPELVSHAVTG